MRSTDLGTGVRRLVVAVAAAASVGALAGCGSAPSGTPAPPAGSPTGTSTTPSGGSSDTPAGTLTKADLGGRLLSAMRKARSYHFQLVTAVAGQSTRGSGDATYPSPPAKPTMTMRMSLPGGQSMRMRLVDGIFYLHSAAIPLSKPWLKIDPSAPSGLGSLVGQFGGTSDPSRSLAVMKHASSVTRTGTATIDGASTTAYAVVLPVKAMSKVLSYPKQVLAMLPKQLHYTIWVDSADRTRRLRSTVSIQGNTAQTTITFSRFGEKVAVTAPPASQTTSRLPRNG